jgi:hypothetical protein
LNVTHCAHITPAVKSTRSTAIIITKIRKTLRNSTGITVLTYCIVSFTYYYIYIHIIVLRKTKNDWILFTLLRACVLENTYS